MLNDRWALEFTVNREAFAFINRRIVPNAGVWHDTTIYKRERLPIDSKFKGPAIIEQMDTTTVVEPGDTVSLDKDGNLLIEIGKS